MVLGASIIEKHLEDKVKTGEMSDRPFYLDRFKKDGYLLLRGFFEGPQVDNVRNDAKEVFCLQMREQGLTESRYLASQETTGGKGSIRTGVS